MFPGRLAAVDWGVWGVSPCGGAVDLVWLLRGVCHARQSFVEVGYLQPPPAEPLLFWELESRRRCGSFVVCVGRFVEGSQCAGRFVRSDEVFSRLR